MDWRPALTRGTLAVGWTQNASLSGSSQAYRLQRFALSSSNLAATPTPIHAAVDVPISVGSGHIALAAETPSGLMTAWVDTSGEIYVAPVDLKSCP
jgi:hypothetical protein